MKQAVLAILLAFVMLTPASSQRTIAKSACNLYSDSSRTQKIHSIPGNDTVQVLSFHPITEGYRVVYYGQEGHVYYRNLKNTQALTATRTDAYRSGKKAIMRARPKNNATVNFFGDASTLSLNYERLVFFHPSVFLAGRLGIGYRFEQTGYIAGGDSFVTLPYAATINVGARKHFFEIGMGWTTDLAAAERNIYEPKTFRYVVVGYRYQPVRSNLKSNKRIFFKFNILYFHSEDVIRGMIPIGIAVGKSF
jgi:hypothetical protein